MPRVRWTFLLIASICVADPIWARDHRTAASLGIDVLEEWEFSALKGKQVGLITNQTGVDSNGHSTADLLAKAPGVKLVALFSPEHGIRGQAEAGASITDVFDPRTHLPVYSLYGATQRPTPVMLNAVDVLVFDIQDVGARFYTYLATMGMAMEQAAKRGIEFVVLDRPNPLGGAVLEGPVLDLRYRHFTAYYAVPTRHGFTAGELARWYNEKAQLHAKLQVIPLKNWKRDELWDDTDLEFVPPSPNIQTPTEALLYVGVGMFEATNVAVGRGTAFPFERVGAPWVNGDELALTLNALHLPGATFQSIRFSPTKDLYAGQLCFGVSIKVTDKAVFRPVDFFVYTACALRQASKKEFVLRWDEIAQVTGTRDFELMYNAGRPADDILKAFATSRDAFAAERKPFLLYE